MRVYWLNEVFNYKVVVSVTVQSGSFDFSFTFVDDIPFVDGDFAFGSFEDQFEHNLFDQLKKRSTMFETNPLVFRDFFKENEKVFSLLEKLSIGNGLKLKDNITELLEELDPYSCKENLLE